MLSRAGIAIDPLFALTAAPHAAVTAIVAADDLVTSLTPWAVLLGALAPLIGVVGAATWKAVGSVRRRNTPPAVVALPQGAPVTAETPLERERRERIDDLEQELDEMERRCRRAEHERSVYREQLARLGFDFATIAADDLKE